MGLWQSKQEEFFGERLLSRIPEIPQEIRDYQFPFENLVLEGGGCKTYSYMGALKVLEEIGVLQNIRRFAGASGGAVICSLLAVGYDVRGLYEFFAVDLTKMSSDANFGYITMLPNMMRHFGWHPGLKIYNYIRDHIAAKCDGNPDITFRELYKERKIELCICVSNITKMSLEYCHPKTTPDMPISAAIRMSISLPGFYQPFKFCEHGQTSYYVDGGMLCNYPIFVFDGWYLSMKAEDAFLNKLGSEEPAFGTFNKKTVGMLVYATEDAEMLRTDLHARYDNFTLERPDTELARSREEECDRQLEKLKQRDQLAKAAKSFWRSLRKSDLDMDGVITLTEFKRAMKATPGKDLELLFGTSFLDERAFDAMDTNHDGELTFEEFIHFMDQKGVDFRETMEGCATRRDFETMGSFAEALIDTMSMTISKFLIKPHDLMRTIGVHTDYVLTTDFAINDDDREYMVARAEHAAIAYLQDYIEHERSQLRSHHYLLRNKPRNSIVRDTAF